MIWSERWGFVQIAAARIAALDSAWERWFARQGVEPLRIEYSALSNDPQGVLARVLSALGIDPTRARSVETPTVKLADATSREWRVRFESEK